MTGSQLDVAVALLQQDGFSVGIDPGEPRGPGRRSARAGPAGGRDLARLLLPQLLLLEAGGRADGQPGSRHRQGPVDQRPGRRRSDRKARSGGLRSRDRRVQLRIGRRRRGDLFRTEGRLDCDPRLDRDDLRLQRSQAGEGAGPGRRPAAACGAADPRPRPRPQRLRRRKLFTRGSGDQPVAERGKRGAARLDRLDRRRQGRRRSEGAERDRQAPLRSGAGDPGRRPGSERRRRRNRSARPGRPRHSTSSRRPARNSNPAPK